jgi:hypothetical protein
MKLKMNKSLFTWDYLEYLLGAFFVAVDTIVLFNQLHGAARILILISGFLLVLTLVVRYVNKRK